jgi:hypothetical protein
MPEQDRQNLTFVEIGHGVGFRRGARHGKRCQGERANGRRNVSA